MFTAAQMEHVYQMGTRFLFSWQASASLQKVQCTDYSVQIYQVRVKI
uniref:Uncharacterized protein n=1 Tax=Anguilla anguilla TaxID=7936 RepID=A0A0E9PBU6_ANGAN